MDAEKATAVGRLVELAVNHLSESFVAALVDEIEHELACGGTGSKPPRPQLVMTQSQRAAQARRDEVRAMLESV